MANSLLVRLAATLSIGVASACSYAASTNGDVLSGKRLYADVKRYAAFGVHRFGSDADRATTDWIANELERAGFDTQFQSFTVDKQYLLSSASVRAGSSTFPALPLWWPPPDKASINLRALIAEDAPTDATGRVVSIRLPFDGGAYLGDGQREAIAAATVRAPAAILLVIESPGEEAYAYNVAQSDPPWPVPVLIVGSRYSAALQSAQRAAQPVEIAVDGRYVSNVAGRNVVGRLHRGGTETIVVSTPTTGWFTCACERGSGVAVFLALARTVAAGRDNMNYVFVATAGHEIGHGGMDVFLQRDAPKPASTRAWIHLGASLACYEWRKRGSEWIASDTLESRRFLLYSSRAAAVASAGFAQVAANRVLVDGRPALGELREVQAAGYPNFLGLAGSHRFFHSASDTPQTTGPEALGPVARAFARVLDLMRMDDNL